jgi:hypothetical protein
MEMIHDLLLKEMETRSPRPHSQPPERFQTVKRKSGAAAERTAGKKGSARAQDLRARIDTPRGADALSFFFAP